MRMSIDLLEKFDKPAKGALRLTPSNNHGCRGYSVDVDPTSDGEALVVVAGESCSSCWQVGHDNGETPLAVGTVLHLPAEWPDDLKHVRVWIDPNTGPVGYNSKDVRVEWGESNFGPVAAKYVELGNLPILWANLFAECGHSHNELVSDEGRPQCDTNVGGLIFL